MKGEIARNITDDGLHLEGMLYEPSSKGRGIVLVHCHGFGGSFYGQPFLDFIAADVTARGYDTVALEGHGAGSIKTAYYQAQTQDERVKTVILLSPPDVRGPQKAASEATWTKHVNLAERMVAEGGGPR